MAKIVHGRNATKKDVIIQKAATLFRTKGFNATSMRELAEAVGVEAPSLYNHIGSKSEILQAICFKTADTFNSQLDAAFNDQGATVNKIERVIRFHIHMMLESFDEVYVANHEWKHLKDPWLTNFLNQRRSYEKRLMSIIEKGTRLNELKKINPYVAVVTMLSAVRGLEFWQRHKKSIDARVLENDMVTHLLTGMIK